MSRRKTYLLHEVAVFCDRGMHTRVFWTREAADVFIAAEHLRCIYRGTSRYSRAVAVRLLGEPPEDLQHLQQAEKVC